VKFKYYLNQEGQPTSGGERAAQDFSVTILAIASIPLMLLLFCLGVVAFGALLHLALEHLRPLPLAPNFIQTELKPWLVVLMTAYLASYLYVIRELLRAVANFEIGPTNLLAAAIHVLFGAITAVVIASVASQIFPGHDLTTTALIVAAFAVGFVPELGVRTLLRASRLRLSKSENTEVYKAFTTTPLEIIDGIDTEMRSRLAQYNITTVQHLATANPIMLSVETPYSIYQIIDWVAQAQLCSALGQKAIANSGSLGSGRSSTSSARSWDRPLRRSCGTRSARSSSRPLSGAGAGWGSAPTPRSRRRPTRPDIGLGAVLLDDLHIHRLRQICNRIAGRLGPENLRLGMFPTAGASPDLKVAA
jgi:hypothetical protein